MGSQHFSVCLSAMAFESFDLLNLIPYNLKYETAVELWCSIACYLNLVMLSEISNKIYNIDLI